MTNYPLGVFKVLPYRVHLALDAVGALALASAPFVTGRYRRGPRQWVPQVALCVLELCSLLLTDPTGRGDYHGDIGAVRAANSESPKAQIFAGGPAVRRAVA